jgi:K+-transporting ATPase KdpF subunit
LGALSDARRPCRNPDELFHRASSGRNWETLHAGCTDVAVHRSFLRRGVSLRQGLPEVEVALMHMDWISATGLILSILLMVYLTVALLFPEKF